MARKKAVSVPPREAKLFRNNKSQALRIPADFELPGDRVMIHRDGDRLIIEPVRRKNLLEVLASLQPLGPDEQPGDQSDQQKLLDREPEEHALRLPPRLSARRRLSP